MEYQVFDGHCDTTYEIMQQHTGLQNNTLNLDIERMEEYNGYIQVFASFIDKKNILCSPINHCIQLLDKIHSEIELSSGRLTLIQSKNDLEDAKNNHKTAAILSIEGGEALEGNLSALRMYYNLGVRLITLTWNYANEISDGITEVRGGGLTEFGRQVINTMEKMGIIVDVSHISEKGFWDVANLAHKPFIASHSCVKSICNHPRNLSDEQIDFMIKNNCCIGINFYTEFLTHSSVCTTQNVIEHMKYILNMGGEDILGIGSDFDGVSDNLPDNLRGVQDIKFLITHMLQSGISETQVKNIIFDNFYRFFLKNLH